MTDQQRGRRRGDLAATLLAAALMVELSVASVAVLVRSAPAPAPLAAPVVLAPVAPSASASASPAVPSAPAVRPPALVLRQPLLPLALTRVGELEVPRRAQDLGRWADGPVPGDVGAAVLVGHVDLDGRAGVFQQLGRLSVGDLVSVRRPDGRDVTFRVTRSLRVAKSAFPTDLVYAASTRRELRLITCGGSFDRLRGHYRDNVVVFAELTTG